MTPKELKIHQAKIQLAFAKHAFASAEEALSKAKAKECRTINVSSNRKAFIEIIQYLRFETVGVPNFNFGYTWNLDEQSFVTIWGDDTQRLNSVTCRIYELSN